MNGGSLIAYFSMEVALTPEMPTYSGGLGVLAGDTVRSAADMHVPMVAVTLLHRKGYFFQRLDDAGRQSEAEVEWSPSDCLIEMQPRVRVVLEGREVQIRAWRYTVTGVDGHEVPVYLLDTDVPENGAWDRTLTHYLYGGDGHYRICQEVILGIGGARMVQALGHTDVERFHMNEGHAALLTLELLEEQLAAAGRDLPEAVDLDAVRRRCVFTTHTAVPAGQDRFSMDLVARVLGQRRMFEATEVFCCEGELNMTFLALNLSHYVNGVAKKHGEISRHLFARYVIDSITNGVHPGTWAAPPFQRLFDRHIPGWRKDSFSLRYALGIPVAELWAAHQEAKAALIHHVNQEKNAGFSLETCTVGFARRMAPYKRADLLFHDPERLAAIAARAGGLQIVYAGKAHPRDERGKELIENIFGAIKALKGRVKVVYLDNYGLELGGLMTAGVDVWLNTPQAPMEASGTSGMKAAVNGVPSLSVLDGWWIEGCIEGVTGWAIGHNGRNHAWNETPDDARDSAELLDKLEQVILPAFYGDHGAFTGIMRHAIALNASFFNTQRMMQQYVLKAYYL